MAQTTIPAFSSKNTQLQVRDADGDWQKVDFIRNLNFSENAAPVTTESSYDDSVSITGQHTPQALSFDAVVYDDDDPGILALQHDTDGESNRSGVVLRALLSYPESYAKGGSGGTAEVTASTGVVTLMGGNKTQIESDFATGPFGAGLILKIDAVDTLYRFKRPIVENDAIKTGGLVVTPATAGAAGTYEIWKPSFIYNFRASLVSYSLSAPEGGFKTATFNMQLNNPLPKGIANITITDVYL